MIVGHEFLRKHLLNLIAQKKVQHALLFRGSNGIGKGLVAKEFAQHLLSDGFPQAHLKIASGNHPDLHIYYPEGKISLYSIDTIRAITQEVAMQPNESKWKVFILHDAEKMLPTAANALLKTLEEPTPNTVIILISSNPDSILSTLLSRCYTLTFAPLPQKDVEKIILSWGKTPQEAKQFALRSLGSLVQAKMLMNQNPYRDLISDFLSSHQSSYLLIQKTVQELDSLLKKELEDFEKIIKKENRFDLDLDNLVHAKQIELCRFLLESVLDWYRDKNPESFEKIYSFVNETEISLQRSLKFSSCFEALFLKLS